MTCSAEPRSFQGEEVRLAAELKEPQGEEGAPGEAVSGAWILGVTLPSIQGSATQQQWNASSLCNLTSSHSQLKTPKRKGVKLTLIICLTQ